MKQIIAKWSLGKELLPSSWWIPIKLFQSYGYLKSHGHFWKNAINLTIDMTEEPYLGSGF